MHFSAMAGLVVPAMTNSTQGKIALRNILDALHAGGGHSGPGGVERAVKINRPAAGLDKHDVEPKPARVHGRVVDAKIGRESGQEKTPETALAQITGEAGRRAPIVFIESGIGIDRRPKAFSDYQLGALRV